jgi:hypothetical protein
MRRIRIIGLAIAAVLALSAVASASALADHYKPAKGAKAGESFEAKNTNTHVFTVNGNKVECKKDKFVGVVPAESTTLNVTPTYEECKFAGETAKVENSGCEYQFLEPEGEKSPFTGKVNVVNATGKTCTFTITASLFGISCKVHVKAQGPLSKITATSLASEGGLKIASSVEKIAYTSEGGGCELAGIEKSGNAATYTGEVEEKAVQIVHP